MKQNEKNAILQLAAYWSDKKLELEYYKSVHDCLGSQADRMEELGYEEIDIRERRKFEKYLCECSDLLEVLCGSRGIKLWDCEENEAPLQPYENQNTYQPKEPEEDAGPINSYVCPKCGAMLVFRKGETVSQDAYACMRCDYKKLLKNVPCT